jgi:hypothetical protein
MADLSPEAAKLLAARKAAIAELREITGKDRTITDHDVQRLANARLLLDSLTMRMVSGDPVSPGDIRQANDMIDLALEAAGKKAINVDLQIVRDPVDVCPHCGWTKPARAFERREQKPVTIEGEVVQVGAQPPPAIPAPKTLKTAPKPVIEQPFVKDTRPNAPSNGIGGLVWFSGGSERYPLERTK